jgi:hypothetical protein
MVLNGANDLTIVDLAREITGCARTVFIFSRLRGNALKAQQSDRLKS